MSETFVLRLYTASLFSKWGFNDGEEPDWLLDYCDDHGLPHPDDWHDALRALVRSHLLPALSQPVTVYDIDTIHNPIRAATVGGEAVPNALIFGDDDSLSVTPEFVEVPLPDVLRACGISDMICDTGS